MTVGAWVVAATLALGPVAGSAFERTELREPCAQHDPLRQPYFGDTHVHTTYSFDANALGVRNTPRDAYRFARGEPLGLQPYGLDGRPRRSVRLDRPLDFAVVTDHAELLGETYLCQTPGSAGYASMICRVYRRWPLLAYYLVNSRMLNVRDPERYGFCGPDGRHCLEAMAVPWAEIQRAAEDHYDRSGACRFTTFVGYEWSGAPDSNMIHRNVLFRNAVVPAVPASYVDYPTPEGLWERLRADCLDAGTGCDVLTIPHNSNLSSGTLFLPETSAGEPYTAADATRRAAMEPLVEVMQHKGDSECRVVSLLGGVPDELCDFEKLPFSRMDRQRFPFLWREPPRGSYVREILALGLLQEHEHGVNPFKLGIIASTDTHMGTPGLVDEEGFPGHAAGGDTSRVEVPLMPDHVVFNPGGLAVLWAEENSRDALFAAMRRREAYGTSGPRITVRFFGGWGLPEDLCQRPDLARTGYARGVPMGGDLPSPPPGAPAGGLDAAPRFVVSALQDPGTERHPGAPLQRLQIVKLWLEGSEPRERVYEVAGDPDNGAGVDLGSCRRSGEGFGALCTVWRDPDWDAGQRALYYARVVENPSCRWSWHVCRAHGVDCAEPGDLPSELEACCADDFPRTIQERAWTSPIWYTPGGNP